MMSKPNCGIARGELRSTLSRAGPCRSSGQHSLKPTGAKPTICTRDNEMKGRRGQKCQICTRESRDPRRHRRAVTYLVLMKYMANITMMSKPNCGIARGELRSTLSRAGPCRSSGQHSLKPTGAKPTICTRDNEMKGRRGQKPTICTRGAQ